MKRLKVVILVVIIAVVAAIILIFLKKKDSSDLLSVRYPFNNALFPPEFPAPSFEWVNESDYEGEWEITLTTAENKFTTKDYTRLTTWTPAKSLWDSLKLMSGDSKIHFRVNKPGNKKIADRITFRISRDSVGAPILFRQ
ncbi:MAG TPA: hypothetical protein PK521_13025, partial [Bacteroidales bacterium]|nr:hypothetical protein [Bacteroidales bacterium]